MAQFTVNITLGNDAMRTPAHVAYTLRKIADYLAAFETWEPGMRVRTLRDLNGNKVGTTSYDDGDT